MHRDGQRRTCQALLALVANLVIAVNSLCQTQHLEFEHYSVEHGLSHSAVYCIVQDSKGFLWIGTRSGLNRFDGYSFTVYRSNLLDSTSLASGQILSLFEDRSGNIWVGTEGGGLHRYDRSKNNFRRYKHNSRNPWSISGDAVGPVYEDKSGCLWIGANGLDRFDPGIEMFFHYQHDSSKSQTLGDNMVTFIHEDRFGNFWIGTSRGLDLFDRQAGTFKHFIHNVRNPRSISSNALWPVWEDRDGALWIGTFDGGLNKFNRATNDFTHYRHDPKNPHSLGNDRVSAIGEDEQGRLWIGTYERGGLNIFDPRLRGNQVFDRYRHDPNDHTSLCENRIRAIYRDRSNNFWIGTDNGLDKVSRTNRFTVYARGNQIGRAIRDRQGRLWVATMGSGVFVLDKTGKEVAHYRHDPSNPASVSSDYATIFEDSDGIIWVGGKGLDRFEPKTKTFQHHQHNPSDPNTIRNDNVAFISGDRSGRLWIQTYAGWNVYDKGTGRFVIKEDLDREFYQDHLGQQWLATGMGLVRRTAATGTLTRFLHDPLNPKSLSDNRVMAIVEDKEGKLWIGTRGGGLNEFNRENETFTRYTTREGLSNDVIYGMLVDLDGCLWIGTENGLSNFHPKTQRFRNYTVEDGLPSNNFYWGTPFLAQDGECVFGTSNGVVLFYPREIEPNLKPPPIILTSFKTLHKTVKFGRDISEIQEVEITYRENVFSFEFATLDFTNPNKNQYAYTMVGFDEDWVYAGARHFATYTNLDPGTYTFRVKGSNSDGVWNEEGLAVKLVIVPPVWLRWWFLTLVALLIVSTVVYLYNWRVEKLLAVERTRDRIARDLHDDIASTLGSVALYVASLRGKLKKPTKEAKNLLERISTLSLEAIDSMGDIVWSVSPRNDTLNDLLIHMRDLTSQICTANGIEYSTKIVPLSQDAKLQPDVRKNIYLVFKESINNVVKHARATHVTVATEMHNRIFEMTIWDDGKGFDVKRSGLGVKDSGLRKKMARGHGLRSMEKRAKEIKAELTIKSALGHGTTVKLIHRMT